MQDRSNESNRTENPAEARRVKSCVDALLALEKVQGTRALCLAMQELDKDDDGFGARKWAALPERRESFLGVYRAFFESQGRAAAEIDKILSTEYPFQVTAEPFPPVEETRLYQLALQVANEPIPEDDDAPPSAAAVALREELDKQ